MESQILRSRQPSITHLGLCRFCSTQRLKKTGLRSRDHYKLTVPLRLLWTLLSSPTQTISRKICMANGCTRDPIQMYASGSNVYYLRRLHSVHPSNKAFRRIVAIIFGEYVSILTIFVCVFPVSCDVISCQCVWLVPCAYFVHKSCVLTLFLQLCSEF